MQRGEPIRAGGGGVVRTGIAAARILATLALLAGPAMAAPGDILLEDDFESGFGAWTTTDPSRSGVNSMTSDSGTRSLYLVGGSVSTTTPVVDTRVGAIRVQAWIRRGDNAFSDRPEPNEDLTVEYLDASASWVPLMSYPGGNPAGEIFTLDQVLAGTALHADFQLRFRMPSGNGGTTRDYWHIDDVGLTEIDLPTGFDLGSCEEFEGGLAGWTVESTLGEALITSQTANSGTYSLAMNGGGVSATANAVDLVGASDLSVTMWIRRGDDDFSEDPDHGDDLTIEYLDASAQWNTLAVYTGNGPKGRIYTPTFSLPVEAAHTDFRLRFDLAGDDGPPFDYWHIDSVCLEGEIQRGEWRFEETDWNGSPSEVVDATGNGHDGTALGGGQPATSDPAILGSPGTCAYAAFDGIDDTIEIPHDPDLLGDRALTYSAWVRPRSWSGLRSIMSKSVHGGGSGRAQMGLFGESGVLKGRAETLAGRYEVQTTLPPIDAWSHVALVFDESALRLYVDGAERASTTFSVTELLINTDSLTIGSDYGSGASFFDGEIDEVRVYASALSEAAIGAIMNETHVCTEQAVVPRIVHDGYGVHCQPETFDVTIEDPSGNVVTTWEGMITLETQTGTGTFALVSGNGSFSDPTPDDGVATYAFDASDGGIASFALDYSTGPTTVDVDAYSGAYRDDDSEGPLLFAPNAFTVTASALSNPPPSPIADPVGHQTAGSGFAMHLAAYGTAPGDPSCGIIESYDGDRLLRFWIDHQNPASAPLVPMVDTLPIAASEASAVDQTVSFSQGQAVVTVLYRDVGRISIELADVQDTAPIRGSTGAFVSRPADLVISDVANAAGDPNPGVDVPTGELFARAGEPLTIGVEAREAGGALAPSFGLESPAEGLRLRSAVLVAPSGGRNGTADDGAIENATAFSATATPGRFEGSTFAFDEVGAIRLEASIADGDYLGSGDVVGTTSGIVGRFAPARFAVSDNTPRLSTACAIGAFTWMDQPFNYAPGEETVLTVRAVNAAGDTTANYRDTWWRLGNDDLANRSYSVGGATVDQTGLPPISDDPDVDPNHDGTGALTFSTGSGLKIARGAPVAPFNAEIALSIDVLDADGTVWPGNPYVVGGTSPGTGIAFDVSKRFQYGRLAFTNAHGSELVDLSMALRAQRFDGAGFVDDDNDSCSSVPVTAIFATPSPSTLSAPASMANDPMLSGDTGLSLAAPGDTGYLELRVDLSSSGANLPWLQYDWPEDGNLDGVLDDDPRARATFGIWEGRGPLIFMREVY